LTGAAWGQEPKAVKSYLFEIEEFINKPSKKKYTVELWVLWIFCEECLRFSERIFGETTPTNSNDMFQMKKVH